MTHNTVEMNFDGHIINLAVDTASYKSYLVYGGWYESLYDPGSCKYLISGCYFCPPNDSCDLDSLLAQKVYKTRYGNGEVVRYVNRKVNSITTERELTKLEIDLVVWSSRVKRGIQPFAMLGLSLPKPGANEETKAPSFLKQLVRTGAIPYLTIAVHVSKFSLGLNGRLVLGEPVVEVKDATLFPLTRPSWRNGTIVVSACAAKVRSPSSSERVAELTNLQGCIDVVIDTCADATVVPDKVFSMIRKTIEVEFGRDRVDGTGKAPSTKSRKLAAYVDAKGWIWFRRSVIERLPVVAVQVHAASSFEVRLSNRVQVCDGG
ncbi:hypothetical protein FOL46_008151 [Perkinsus olseni]|uniref:Uncharacterized protein n=1 Tax=Perkinsus olseni TaxID=32597 RepID=A0A7J6MMS3_PEROL|nr:hypothetical protein FOL46_008151 [Perkinsus olseni]